MKFSLGLLAAVAAVAFAVIGMAISANNAAVGYEKKLEMVWEDNQNILSQYGNKLAEAAQIPERYKADFVEVMKAEMEGRYGKNGQQILANWVQERQLSYDSSLYTKLQAMIEAGRNEFQLAQTKLLDVKRAYETDLGSVITGFFMKWWGFPKTDLSKYKVVKTDAAIESFTTGKDKPLEIFPKK